MTAIVTPRPAPLLTDGAVPAARPTFPGVLRGELFKVARQRLNWVMILGVTAITLLVFPFPLTNAGVRQELQHQPQTFLYQFMGITLSVQRIFVGVFLLVATARMVGLDYQQGTIRVLLARGVGRLQLLGAKLLAMTIAALVIFAWGLLLNAVGGVAIVVAGTGTFQGVAALTGRFWAATGIYILTVLMSMGVSILLAASVTIVTRSLAFGLAGALSWFAADNIGVLFIVLISRFTQSALWPDLTGYLLGPELNLMPVVVVPALARTMVTPTGVVSAPMPALSIGIPPLVTYDGRHVVVVALVYGVIFAAAAALVIWRRDVLE
jgi:ABC-type transport system involved in multi-copper enzyme maturation permease subunit